MKKKVALVLHAHYPYYGTYDMEDSETNTGKVGERWLFEGIAECYFPLVWALKEMEEKKLPFFLTMSFTPILMEQLRSADSQNRFSEYLQERILTSRGDAKDERFQDMALDYANHYERVLRDFDMLRNEGRTVLDEFKELALRGRIQLIVGGAVHAYAPLLRCYNDMASQVFQVVHAKKYFRDVFGFDSEGFWIPECGYEPGYERFLEYAGFKYAILDPKALKTKTESADTRKIYRFPLSTVKFGAIDWDCNKKLWGPTADSYAPSGIYREFFKWHKGSGNKYWKITDVSVGLSDKKIYEPDKIEEKLYFDAEDYVRFAAKRFEDKDDPILLATDAELFGHWWHEGPRFLSKLAEQACKGGLDFVPLREVFDNAESDELNPQKSSWGRLADDMEWINKNLNEFIYNITYRSNLFKGMCDGSKRTELTVDYKKVLQQMAVELLCLHTSCWFFELSNKRQSGYGKYRIEKHLANFDYLYSAFSGLVKIDNSKLEEMSKAMSFFNDADLTKIHDIQDFVGFALKKSETEDQLEKVLRDTKDKFLADRQAELVKLGDK